MDTKKNIADKIKSNLEYVINLFNQLEETYSNLKVQEEYRIIHFKDNPFELDVRKRQSEFERLKEENEKLTVRLHLLESGNEADVTRLINQTGDKSSQIDDLTRQINEMKQAEVKLLTSFSKIGREFREVFYLLTGLRVQALKDGIYEISNMYAENEADKLFLQLSPDGTTQLLQNDYSDKLSTFIETYLEKADSFPAFLAAITLNLYNSSSEDSVYTETNQSVDMETTVIRREK